ncbi:hypothetical protein [Halorhabdus amylolytica]|uniref:hypothetical protein n=1 Tax=Halorhabdus amylolytica TaxID=2559573 RepID=UPI0010AA94B5|nr:hypothetical protein [Halorhabdus amylolytica]
MRWHVLAVVVLLSFVGCSAIDGSTETETLTPAPVPTDVPADGPGATVAPGVWADGRLDVTVLVDAHRNAVEDRSFVWRETHGRSGETGSISTKVSTYEKIVYVNDTFFYRDTDEGVNRTNNTLLFYTRYSEYADGTHRYVRAKVFNSEEMQYNRTPISGDGSRIRNHTVDPVRRYLNVTSVDVRPVTVGGDRYYRLVGTELRSMSGGDEWDYSVTATVTPSGLVRNLSARYTLSNGEENETFRYRGTFERLGDVDLEQPNWVQAAENRTADGTTGSPPT